ncbi:chemotaxis protein CheX [uncultured Clostridium sp.]|uniref:chemotaxis protein CheX n=1 Tax=uncultured Clostridium sp. TaxID=59620 RepID=UPI0025EB5628|nr:chemotaxis protein CheX [uncultured Clostridium sp.]
MDVKHINPVIESVTTIMPQLGFAQVSKKGISLKGKNIKSPGVVIVIGLIGDVKGNIIYGLSIDDAKKVASQMMMGMPVDDFNEMAQSAISELVNMLTANVATNYSKNGINVDISTPTLVQGEFIANASTDKVICIEMNVNEIDLQVNISLN